MALNIKWTKRSKSNFDNIINYLELEFGDKTAKLFVQRSYAIIESLSVYPEMGSLEIESKNIRGFLVTKQCRLFYRLSDDYLILLSFFDTRSNPTKKKFG